MLYLSPTSSDTTCVFLKKVDFMSSFLFNILSCIVTDMIYPYLCILLLYGDISSIQSLRCVQLCDPMHCRMPGFPVYHQLLKHAQTPVHWVGDGIQSSHSLLSPSPPAFRIRVFSSESVLRIRWPKFWNFSFSISPSSEFRTDFL